MLWELGYQLVLARRDAGGGETSEKERSIFWWIKLFRFYLSLRQFGLHVRG